MASNSPFLVCLSLFVLVVGLVNESYGAPGHPHAMYGHHRPLDYYARPSYKYEYGVSDKYTGDFKTASEQRDGDKVAGHYALQEPDGSWRTVTYVADPYSGFQAHVQRTPNSQGHAHLQQGAY